MNPALLYRLKRRLQQNLPLYDTLYHLATFNRDYLRQRLDRGRYPSRFGGMWTDRDDFASALSERSQRGELTPPEQAQLQQWHSQGFLELPGAVDPSLIDRYLEELEALKSQPESPLLVTSANLEAPLPYSAAAAELRASGRILDDYFYSASAREILLDSALMGLLGKLFSAPPQLTQSLYFHHGSGQAMHQDTAFVRMNSPLKLAALWVALEDVSPGSGELMYYPGSHRWEGFLFSGRFKHWDEERDGVQQLDQWHKWIQQEAQERSVKPVRFLPRKGDVFAWHGALAHGGSPITHSQRSRRSLVAHYCPRGVRPLYHYYKPSQRRFYQAQSHRYCSAYYV